MRPSRLYPLLVHPASGELIALYRADAVAAGEPTEDVEACERLLHGTPRAALDPLPLLTGHDLHALGLRPGPDFRRILESVRDAQLDGRARSRAEALQLVAELTEPPAAP